MEAMTYGVPGFLKASILACKSVLTCSTRSPLINQLFRVWELI
jgi:hypothetical protein